jgi:hypothetical protein
MQRSAANDIMIYVLHIRPLKSCLLKLLTIQASYEETGDSSWFEQEHSAPKGSFDRSIKDQTGHSERIKCSR